MLFALESRFGVDVNWLLRGGPGPTRVDNAMTPTLPPGAIVGIDRSRTAVSDGAVYLVSLKEPFGEHPTIRRLYKVRGGLRLRADNERHADLTALRKQARVVGRVVWSLQRLA